ncbi:bifunctional 4-hydroxy-2-oxoglutarate aldolase/2-dehydro-3-deoxy-phosphogluconate aldolase [Neoroseomonas oryzicola]|uniref:Bifunctional 4-hydroxy-2-oxoglutarate aldolase/2-dehydro-3-deoxy-phosphogluconate aldolase n=1 Tax=Neoroseomonas oryzicola TaxID=535904 RepID=A0A9X9WCJ4_9PROT|nr:bifunctional 4-hydroxy-2-oxoglutarate aldolase/2-dehydro-3-deoxy-phosphogluconate aldolase [Neoroseomonas oryzicola]MBR0658054.1 bifunctional 4-hydroxy-2-oxoglutarate aldolase/2-dehydro-3-deoxy-phosphogluconate aldolase [Neoroseomonas oryzicola]NKE15417.1 bifunctional 4-hydroxy-2-oxoglutarate aldolase/2-dehydro-3-deoxy-phosphogluconate aldolase [Neoroseomonas oryzicola]
MHPLIPRLRAARIIPVVRALSAARAATAVAWLQEAGITVFEITMTVPEAPALIRALAQDPALLVGAGTVPDARTAEACIEAGAKFIVAPWVDATLASPCQDAGACLMLGAMTPTEVRAALDAGADVVKIFPASSAGGPAHIRSIRAVFPDVAFCPTGGVDARNAPDYLAAGAAFVGIGGRLVDEKLVAAGDRAAVQRAAEEALGIMRA